MLRFFSRRRTRNNHKDGCAGAAGGGRSAVDSVASPPKPKIDKHHVECRITLLDQTDLSVIVPKKSLGSYLYEQVYDLQDILEKDYFGLQFMDSENVTHWLDPTKLIKKQVKIGPPYTFRLRVKFYPVEPNTLREELTRYMFFLQLKDDILHGRLDCPEDKAAELAALALQSELGDYDEHVHSAATVSEFRFVPNQTEEFEIELLEQFKTCRGLTPAQAESAYLNKAKWLDGYGVDMHDVIGKDNETYCLGLSPNGIFVVEDNQRIGLFIWNKISTVDFKKNKITLVVCEEDDTGATQEITFVFTKSSLKACKHLWKCVVEYHSFFRLRGPPKEASTRHNLFRLGSRFRYSGRTEFQAAYQSRARRTVQFERRPSQRFASRQSHLARESKKTTQESAASALAAVNARAAAAAAASAAAASTAAAADIKSLSSSTSASAVSPSSSVQTVIQREDAHCSLSAHSGSQCNVFTSMGRQSYKSNSSNDDVFYNKPAGSVGKSAGLKVTLEAEQATIHFEDTNPFRNAASNYNSFGKASVSSSGQASIKSCLSDKDKELDSLLKSIVKEPSQSLLANEAINDANSIRLTINKTYDMDHHTETLKRLSQSEKPNNQVKLPNIGATPLPATNIKCNILKALVEGEHAGGATTAAATTTTTTTNNAKLNNQMFVPAANHQQHQHHHHNGGAVLQNDGPDALNATYISVKSNDNNNKCNVNTNSKLITTTNNNNCVKKHAPALTTAAMSNGNGNGNSNGNNNDMVSPWLVSEITPTTKRSHESAAVTATATAPAAATATIVRKRVIITQL